MKKFILAFVGYIINLQNKNYEKKVLEWRGNGAKSIYTTSASLEIKNKLLDEMRKKVIDNITPIIKENIKTPEKILDYIEKNGTAVYKIKNADKILSVIGEEEGFITPIRGIKAIYLNLALKRKVSTRTDEMFVLRNLPINIYIMAHQAFKWYGWKIQMPGYDDKTQEHFKKVWLYEKPEYASKLTYDELANLKEAIERDKEAIDFVIKLARESEGAKQGFDNMQNGGADV